MAIDQNIPLGLCRCGCGERTPIAVRNIKKSGVVKGEPRRFVQGHHSKRPNKSYPRIKRNGRNVAIHRLRAEAALGHPLPPNAVIHHPDEDRANPNARLVICPDNAYHRLLHVRMRVKAAGGNPNTDKICCLCHQVKPLEEFARRFNYCRLCAREYQGLWRRENWDRMNALRRIADAKRRAARLAQQESSN